MTPSSPVQRFFDAFARGDLPALLDTLHPDIVLKAEGPGTVPWYGTYRGLDGARTFLERLGTNVRTQAFTVATLIEQGDTSVAAGHLRHLVPLTDRLFESDWALVCEIRDGRIASYQFFEDTAAAALAFEPAPTLGAPA